MTTSTVAPQKKATSNAELLRKLKEAQARIAELEQIAEAAGEAQKRIDALGRMYVDEQQKALAVGAKLEAANNTIETRDRTIAALKDKCMDLTVQVATRDGYIARANESDPMPTPATPRQFGTRTEPTPMISDFVAYGIREREQNWWNRQ